MVLVSNLTWVLVVLSVLGNIFIIYDKKTTGYVTWLVANTGWIIYDIYIEEYSQMVLFLIYSFLSLLGIYVELKKKEIDEPSRDVVDEPSRDVVDEPSRDVVDEPSRDVVDEP